MRIFVGLIRVQYKRAKSIARGHGRCGDIDMDSIDGHM